MRLIFETGNKKEIKQETKKKNFLSPVSAWVRNGIIEPFTGAWQRNISWRRDDETKDPVVYACINQISSDFAKLPAVLKKQLPTGIWKSHWDSEISPLLRKPNHYQNHIQFKELWINSKLLTGNTYVLKQRDGSGNVIKLFVLDPHRVKPMVTPNGDVYYNISLDDLSQVSDKFELYPFIRELQDLIIPASEIIHDRYNCFYHPLVGLSPLRAAGINVRTSQKIRQHSEEFFSNAAVMSGILTAPGHINDDTAERAKEYFETEFTGDNAGRIAVLGDGLEFKEMTMSSVDSQLIEQLKFSAEQICAVFHVPHHMILGISPGYNSAEAANQQYYSQCLQYYIESFEECFDNSFGLNQGKSNNLGIELDLSALLRMDTTTRFSAYDKAIRGSFMTIDEVRFQEDLDSVEGGNKIWMQQQNYSTGALDERDRNNPFEKPAEPVAVVQQDSNTNSDNLDSVAVESVQDTALNGAQIESLLSIIEQVTAGVLPKTSAAAIIQVAFPTMDPAEVSSILDPIVVKPSSVVSETPEPPAPVNTVDQDENLMNNFIEALKKSFGEDDVEL